MTTNQPITEELASKVLDAVSCGLVKGLGIQEKGKMCIEAAVCFAYGLPHSDEPPCVGRAVRRYKIRLNDANWSSNEARGKGMRALSIAQLNSIELDQEEFARRIVLKTINTIIADIAAKFLPEIEKELREVTDLKAARELCLQLKKKTAYAYAAAYAAAAAADDAYAAADDAYAAAAAAAAADAADAADADAADAAAEKSDTILIQAANNCLEVLKEMKSPGCEFLYLLDR